MVNGRLIGENLRDRKKSVASTSSGKEKRNTVGFFSTALFLERLDATGTGETQGGLLIYTPALGRAMCPPGIGTLICMHLLGRGWRQIRASACAVALFTATVYWRPVPSFRRRLPTVLLQSTHLLTYSHPRRCLPDWTTLPPSSPPFLNFSPFL